jgi:tRNA-2-methylthio-N6-dimethylallyladenosine synthase
MGKKLYIKTYGCQMNEYDSDKTVDILKQKKGVEVTNDIKEADIILLNTCSIREKAEAKVYSELGRLNKLKEKKSKFEDWCRWLCCYSGRGKYSKKSSIC